MRVKWRDRERAPDNFMNQPRPLWMHENSRYAGKWLISVECAFGAAPSFSICFCSSKSFFFYKFPTNSRIEKSIFLIYFNFVMSFYFATIFREESEWAGRRFFFSVYRLIWSKRALNRNGNYISSAMCAAHWTDLCRGTGFVVISLFYPGVREKYKRNP